MSAKKTVTSIPKKRKPASTDSENETSLREYQAILATAEEVAQIGSWKWDLRTQKVTWSDEMFRLFGVEREDFDGDVNRVVTERIHPEDAAAVTESNRKVLEEAEPVPMSYRILLPDGTERTVWAQGKLIRDETGQPVALTGYVQDITERVRAEKKLMQMKRLYATLSQVNQMIVRVKEQNELFQTICDVAVEFGEFPIAWVSLLDDESGDMQPVAARGLDIHTWPFPIVNIHKREFEGALVPTAILTSKVTTSENVQLDVRTRKFGDSFQAQNIRAVAVIPFQLRGKSIGMVGIISHDAGLFRDEDEIRLLEEMGLDISFALDNMDNEFKRRKAEEERFRFMQVLESSLNEIYIFEDPTLRFTFVNQGALMNLGYSMDELRLMTPVDLKPEFTEESFRDMICTLIRREKDILIFETIHRRKNGGTYPVEVHLQLVETGDSRSFVAIIHDISERKQAEIEVLSLSKFPEENPNPVFRVAKDGILLYANQSGQPLLDFWMCIVGSPLPNDLQKMVSTVLQSGKPKELEVVCGDRVFSIIFAPILEGEYVNGYGRDITERKQVQDELRLLNMKLEQRVAERTAELEQANRAKDEFLANMSHELRTPLNTVLGLSETLLEQQRGPLNERQVQSLELISSSGRHLLGLINDILEVSKIDAGKLQLYSTAVSVKELCESSLNFIREMAVKKSIKIEYINEEPISTLYADPQRLKQILINLLMNAIKFTPELGSVSLKVFTDTERDSVGFSVTDTGIGIAQEDLKKLFTPFTQLDSSLARQYAGTGLGLALVQKLTDLHGGSVHVESDLGKGSCFTIYLPWKTESQTQMEVPVFGAERLAVEGRGTHFAEEPRERDSILLAEDNEANIITIREYLEAFGYDVLVAHNGFEAIEKAKAVNPDIILMDIQMPAMDGLEAMRLLRTDARFVTTPIIALTALAMPGDRERCLSAGADEYMSKPVSLKELVNTIASFLKQKKK